MSINYFILDSGNKIPIYEELKLPNGNIVLGWNKEEGIFDGYVVIKEETIDPIVIPKSITPLQARKILRITGLKESVDSWISQQSEEVKDEWEYATTVERNNPTLLQAAEVLGLTSSQLDELFLQASRL